MEDEKRGQALRYLNITGISQCLVGAILLILGVVSRLKHGPYIEGVPPYYSGAFIGMTMVLIQAAVGLAVFIRGKECVNKLEAAEKVGCIMQTYCLLAIATNVGYLVAVLMISFTGVCLKSECSYTEVRENRRLAVTILVFICVGVMTSAIGLVIVCKFSSSFGLKMLSRGQYQISNMVDNTDDVIAYIAAEQTAGTNITENQANHHHHSHPDPRLAFPDPDFSTQHLQHYLTQQYRDRIRKRRRKNRNKKRNKQNRTEDESRRRRQEREAPYVLPPVAGQDYYERDVPYVLPPVLGQNKHHRSRSPTWTPPPPPPSPPMAPVHYPPPSPSPPLAHSPLNSRRTPPLSPSTLPLPDIIPPRYSPSPQSSGTPSPPPPTPPLPHPAVIHVIPCGETYDDEPPPYSP